ncbi:hypothetical protein CVT24_002649 [Panaeolus cyanescens]|uniref:Uncharacterized protein n=1 Tax=Panaeolus cyanescens TaxID=181874 RepID=A0A409YY75_9AGAR|nr:hypothetical protein CVT24_002649 [Panaeolus cyanescens]
MMAELAESPIASPTTRDNSSLEEIKQRLDAHVSEVSILRDNEYCNKADFLDNLSQDTVDLISNISKSERSVYQAEFCSRKGEEELMTAVSSGSSSALDNAIAWGALAVKYMQPNVPERGIILSMFGRTLRYRWRLTQNDAHLDDTIYYFTKTVEMEREEEPNRALHLDDLGIMLLERYTKHHDEKDFEAAMLVFKQAAGLPHSGKPLFLSHQARLLKAKAMHAPQICEMLLGESLEMHYQALHSVTPQFRGSLQNIYLHLVDTFVAVYTSRGSSVPKQLDADAQEHLREAKENWRFYHELAVALLDRYRKQHGRPDLETSFTFLQEALSRMSKTGANTATIDALMAEVLEKMAIFDGSLSELAEAIRFAEKAVNATHSTDSAIANRMSTLCFLHQRIFDLNADTQALTKSIEIAQRALSLPGCANTKWMFYQRLGISYGYRFKANRGPADLEEAISSFESALKENLLPFDKMNTHQEYARALSFAYPFTQKAEHIDAAIYHNDSALALTTEDMPAIVSCYEAFSIIYMNKYEVTGDVADIHKATSYALQAVSYIDHFPSRKHEKSRYFTCLGNAFYAQYDTADQTADLNQAIFYYDQSVRHTILGDARYFIRMGSLCRALLRKFFATKSVEHFNTVKDHIQEALAMTNPIPSVSDSAFLHDILGTGYLYAYYMAQDSAVPNIHAIHCAIEQFQASIATNCGIPSVINPPMINLLNASIAKYSVTKSDEDLVQTAGRILQYMPILQSSLTKHELVFLVRKVAEFCTLFYNSKKINQFGLFATFLHTSVAMEQSMVSHIRLDSAVEAATLSYQTLSTVKPEGAAQLIKYAAELLPTTILVATSRADQLRSLRRLSMLPSLGLSFYLVAKNSATEALHIYEQTRSLVWNRFLDLKTDLGDLEEKHPDLAARLKLIRTKLDQGPTQNVIASETTGRARLEKTQLAHEYDAVINTIRKLDGFKDFLRSQSPSSLTDSARDGPVIVVNVTKYRSDALLVTAEEVSCLPLPKFSLDVVMGLAAKFEQALEALHTDQIKASEMMSGVVLGLWETVAEPVLNTLGIWRGNRASESVVGYDQMDPFPAHSCSWRPRKGDTHWRKVQRLG